MPDPIIVAYNASEEDKKIMEDAINSVDSPQDVIWMNKAYPGTNESRLLSRMGNFPISELNVYTTLASGS